MKKVVVTGGSGFIGSNLVEILLEQGTQITILDDYSNGSDKNIEKFRNNIEIIKFDISSTDWSSLDSIKPDVIFHLATHPRSFSLKDPYRNLQVNVIGTLNLLEFARKNKSKVIYTSNTGIYGNPSPLPVDESYKDNPLTPYDANKLIGEHYGKIYHEIYGLYFVAFRLGTVYGERQRINEDLKWHPVIPELVHRLINNEIPTIHWDGLQTRDFIYVKDVVNGLILAANSTNASGEVFNLSTNTETSIREVFDLICKILNRKVEPKSGTKLPGDIRRMCYKFDKAKKLLGYFPSYTLEEGLRKYIKWFSNS